MSLTSRVKRVSAFTLVELLVVIAIIAVLMAVLMPSLRRTREQARMTACQAHLKQIGMAMHMYAPDYDDKFPDKYTLGGFNFRAAPGYKNPNDKRGLPEKYGLAAILDETHNMEGKSKAWRCPGQPLRWMLELDNTYAFSTATIFEKNKTFQLKRYDTTWMVWDNWNFRNYTPGWRASSGSGFTIPADERVMPHNGRDQSKTKFAFFNILFADSHVSTRRDQYKSDH